jgi:hypothetical protein
MRPAGAGWASSSRAWASTSLYLCARMNQSCPFIPYSSMNPAIQGAYNPGAAFTWSPGGSELAYLVEGPFVYRGTNYQPANRAVTQLRRVIMSPSRMPVSLEEPVLVEMPYMDGLRDVSWSPDGTSLAMLQGLPDESCWSVLVGRTPQVNGTPMEIYPVEGLCVEGHLTTARGRRMGAGWWSAGAGTAAMPPFMPWMCAR